MVSLQTSASRTSQRARSIRLTPHTCRYEAWLDPQRKLHHAFFGADYAGCDTAAKVPCITWRPPFDSWSLISEVVHSLCCSACTGYSTFLCIDDRGRASRIPAVRPLPTSASCRSRLRVCQPTSPACHLAGVLLHRIDPGRVFRRPPDRCQKATYCGRSVRRPRQL